MTTYYPPQQQRLHWIDNAKGLAIILVLLIHSHIAYSAMAGETSLFRGLHIILTLASASYMALFFFVSGYTYKDKQDALKTRFRKLVIPYAAYGISIILITFLIQIIQDHAVNLPGLLKDLGGLFYSRGRLISPCDLFAIEGLTYFRLMPEGTGPMWFLTSLFTSYALFIPLHRAKESHKPIYIIVYILAMYVLSLMPVLLPWSLDLAPFGALLIYAGNWCMNKDILPGPGRHAVIYLLMLVPIYWALFSVNGTCALFMRQYGDSMLWSPMFCLEQGLFGSVLFCIAARYIESFRLNILVAPIGKASLTILCTHMCIFHTWRNACQYLQSISASSIFQSKEFLYLEAPLALIIGLLLHKLIHTRKA